MALRQIGLRRDARSASRGALRARAASELIHTSATMRVLFVLLLTGDACSLFMPPPNPIGVVGQVAELVLRARLRTVTECKVEVRGQASKAVLAGSVDGVRVRGTNWCTPLNLSCRSIDLQVGRTALDFGALLSKRTIVLQQPAVGEASVRFTQEDWSSFLAHPRMLDCVRERQRRHPAPITFARGGVRMLLPSAASLGSSAVGAVEFGVSWDGTPLVARLWQPSGGPAVVETRGGDGASEPPPVRTAAAAEEWLAALFNGLLLNLDGCELGFRSMRLVPPPRTSAVGQPAAAELVLDLAVCVRKFPSLAINF